MDSNLCGLEMRAIEAMTRPQLLQALRRHLDCLPPDLRERLDEKADGWLRVLLLAARMIHALQMLQGPPRGDEPQAQIPPGPSGLSG
jgi:hypothetical protein